MLPTRLPNYATAAGASVAFMLSADLQREVISVFAALVLLKRQVPDLEVNDSAGKLRTGLELSNILRQFDASEEHIMLADLADVVGVLER
jgi:hypothetical protein